MNIKKSWGFIFLFLIGLILFSNFSSAEIDLKQGAETLVQWIEDIFGTFFKALLGDTGYFDQLFFMKILILILVFSVTFSVTRRIDLFKRHSVVRFIVAFSVSVLGMRYITDNQFIQGILLPYGMLAVALSLGLPFLIIFLFIHDSIKTSSGRRFAWGILIAVYLGMWIDRAPELSEGANMMYLIIITIGILTFIFDARMRIRLHNEKMKGILRRSLLGPFNRVEERIRALLSLGELTDRQNEELEHLKDVRKRLSRRMY